MGGENKKKRRKKKGEMSDWENSWLNKSQKEEQLVIASSGLTDVSVSLTNFISKTTGSFSTPPPVTFPPTHSISPSLSRLCLYHILV